MPDEAYSRVTDAAKRRILAARTDAWIASLAPGSQPSRPRPIVAAIADPTGWNELSGSSWLHSLGPAMIQ